MLIPLKTVQLIMLSLRRMCFLLITWAHLYCYNKGLTRPKCFLQKRFHVPLHQSSEERPARNLRNQAVLQESNSPSIPNGSADNTGGYFSRFNLNGCFFRNSHRTIKYKFKREHSLTKIRSASMRKRKKTFLSIP